MQHNSHKELHKEELSIVAENMLAVTAWVSKDLNYLWVNKSYEEWIGLPTERIIGHSIKDVMGESAFDQLMPYFEKVLRGERVHYEEQLEVKGLGRRWLDTSYNPTYDAHGQINGWVAVITDIDARKTAEKALELANRRKDEFLAMLAHELRNPLAVIVNGIQVLDLSVESKCSQCPVGGEACPSPDFCSVKKVECAETRRMILRQARHLSHMVNDLLDVSRITRGKIMLRRTVVVDANEVIKASVEQSRLLMVASNHKLVINLCEEPVKVRGDFTRLVQAVSNLLNNAAKYTPNGGEIVVSSRVQGELAVISVKDNGIGIAKDQQDYIFDLFVQVDHSLERSQSGLGLGLTLVQEIVRLHGGEVRVYSEGLGCGSEFIMTLPITVGGIKNKIKNNHVKGNARSILVVDDVVDTATSMASALKLSGGHRVWVANSGVVALRMMDQISPEYALLDIGMPGMDGYELAQKIREKYGQGIVLIAVTGYGQEDDKRKSDEAGFNYHLVKPVELEQVEEILNRAR